MSQISSFLVAVFAAFLVGCTSVNPSNELFEQLSKNFDESVLIEFKSSNVDSNGFPLRLIEFGGIDTNSELGKKITAFLNNGTYVEDSSFSTIYLKVNLHFYLNDRLNDSIEIRQLSEGIYDNYWKLRRERYQLENDRIAKKNYQSIGIGDTVELVLPVSSNFGRRSTFYTKGYPYSINYNFVGDSLWLKGELLSKGFEELTNGELDSNSLTFLFELIEVGDTSVEFMYRKCRIGEEFELDLQSYGRLIN